MSSSARSRSPRRRRNYAFEQAFDSANRSYKRMRDREAREIAGEFEDKFVQKQKDDLFFALKQYETAYKELIKA